MPAPRENPIRFVPRTVSDTVDGDNSPEGACLSLANLLWAPDTPGVLLCRPANLELTNFPALTTPGIISVAYQLNGVIYGMIASGSPAGKDRPFAYNISTGMFIAISGIISANCPTTPASTGDWNPPTMDMVGSRLIVTHPGFNFADGFAFGYFDLSGFSDATTGNIASGSNIITGNPNIAGLAPGYTVSGTGIPAGAYVINYSAFTLATTADTNSSTSLTNVANTTGLADGQTVTGLGIPTGTTIASISGTTVTLSQAATATATGISITFDGATITISANAVASTNNLAITIAGGTTAAPLWAAGNTTGVLQLASLPQAVRQFNNRAYFAANQFLVFTDTLSLNISNAEGVQVLTIGDTSPITALCGLPVFTTSGGVLQALIAFKQYACSQVTGDAATGDLAVNEVSGTVGTAAGRSVATTPAGIYFMASDGVRSINLEAQVSEPDTDLALPFIYALHPSRAAASFNSDIYRICVQNGNVLGTPFQEYYYSEKYKAWTGPQSFRVDMSVAYEGDFVVFNTVLPATLWQSYSVQNRGGAGNLFIENGAQLTWNLQTCPMTDTNNMYTNAAVRSTLEIGLPATGDTYTFQGLDESNSVLAQATLTAPTGEAIWDSFDWGDGTLWGASLLGLAPLLIPWTQPLIFNKLSFQGSGNSALGLKIGALYTGYEKLGYLKQ